MPSSSCQLGNVIAVPPVSQFKVPFPYWQRLEPRARTDDFTQSIQARIGDPLWMLARQWQFGEFQGDDAGSPVNATIRTEVTGLTRVRMGGTSAPAVRLDTSSEPLETRVERESPPMNWRIRAQIGQQFERELREQLRERLAEGTIDDAQYHSQYHSIIQSYKVWYALNLPGEDELQMLDDATREFLETVAGEVIDGGVLLSDGFTDADPAAQDALDGLREWYRLLYGEEPGNDTPAWQHDRLEYEFQLSAPDPDPDRPEIVLVAPEYDGKELDWPDFSLLRNANERLTGGGANDERDVVDTQTVEFIPTPVFFRGMPNHRWWEFEDRQIDFGDLTVNSTDLGKLLLMEFALIHGNDWFLHPLPLRAGSLCAIPELSVTDVFAQTAIIKRAGSREGDGWQRWDMFGLTPDGRMIEEADSESGEERSLLFLPPTLPQVEEAPALEEVLFLRDEMANAMWCVERTILNGLGDPQSGYEAYRSRLRRLQEQKDRESAARALAAAEELGSLAEEAAAAAAAAAEATTPEAVASYTEAAEEALGDLRDRAAEGVGESAEEEEGRAVTAVPLVYRLASVVPENWIPYIPFHTGNSQRAVELRQASMVRNMEDQEPIPIDPRSYLLTTAGRGHRLHEETVSRAARRVRLIVQRARWIDGSTHVWIGRDSGPGGGEGSSGLRFDLIEERQAQ